MPSAFPVTLYSKRKFLTCLNRLALSEHPIKEIKLGIQAHRLSCRSFIANQFLVIHQERFRTNMHDYSLLHRIILGFKNKLRKLLITIFVIYASIWTILESLIGLVPSTSQYFSGEFEFLILVLMSSIIGFYKNAIPESILVKYGNSSIKIEFGDIFSCEGFRVIPVSRYFFETQIVPTSLQSKLIQMFIQSQEGDKGFVLYNQTLSTALQNVTYREKYRNETQQKEKYYPLGTTAILGINGQSYMLFSLTETELKGCIPHDNCNVSKMLISLESFWREARVHARGRSISIPLIGSGVTGIRLKPIQLLELNLLAIANAVEEGGKITTEEIKIVLHHKYMEDIDLGNFQDIWN
jgi:Domain of unknown function (DUF6430)